MGDARWQGGDVNIGLLAVDGHRFPNLALMKLSAWHKAQGDHVEWGDMFGSYDRLYMSKVFTFEPDDLMVYDTKETIKGGTGYLDYETTLPEEVEHIMPDYSLFGIDYAVGFTTRGCPNKCSFCVVPKKEGGIRPNAEISEFWSGQKDVVLLDNNILAIDHGIAQLEWSIGKVRVDCNQGMDARIIAKSEYLQDLLGRVKWTRCIRLACDHKSQMPAVKMAIEGIRTKSGMVHSFFVYTLITDDYDDSLERLNFLRSMHGVDPFAQPYRDFTATYNPPQWQKDMARWANHKAIFRKVEFEQYRRASWK
jgi:hypothetical protein